MNLFFQCKLVKFEFDAVYNVALGPMRELISWKCSKTSSFIGPSATFQTALKNIADKLSVHEQTVSKFFSFPLYFHQASKTTESVGVLFDITLHDNLRYLHVHIDAPSRPIFKDGTV